MPMIKMFRIPKISGDSRLKYGTGYYIFTIGISNLYQDFQTTTLKSENTDQ
jgi:hypothetical protein